MADLNGSWNVVVNTPMGPQKSVLSVTINGDSFEGNFKGGLGILPVENGKVDGDTLRWTLNMTAPFPMELTCDATVTGDTIEGIASGGAFGRFPMKGERA